MITIDYLTYIIYIPKSFMLLIQSSPAVIYELNTDTFRLALKDLEDDVSGIAQPTTHSHVSPISISGVQLARVIEILEPYTCEFEDSQYAVNLVGSNNNIADRTIVNQVSIRSANSAGMIQTSSGSGLSVQEHDKLMSVPDENTIADTVLNEAISSHEIAGSVGEMIGKKLLTVSKYLGFK